jgi:predicted PurR-regulated permease PerM
MDVGNRSSSVTARRTSHHPGGKHPPPDASSLRALVSLTSGVVVIGALYFGRAVLIPITLAVLLSFLLAPFVDQLRRLRIGQLPSVLIAVLLTLSCLTAVGTLIGAQIAQLAGDLPRYEVAIERKVDRVEQEAIGRADAFLHRMSNALKRVAPFGEEPALKNVETAGPAGNAPMPVEVHEPSPSPFQLAERFLSPVISPLETAGIMLVVAIFVLLQREDLRDRLIRLFGSHDLYRTTITMDEAARGLSRYFLAQLGVNVSVGMVVGAGLAIIGVPGALLFGVMAALLRFVPYFGTWIGAGLAVIMAAAVGPGWSMALWTFALFGVVEAVAVQFAEPFLYGHSTGLSPFAVVVAAIFWSWIWGPIGLVLSTPLTLCLVILGRHVERLEFLDVLFGVRPALTPAENFYQRLLANDPNEAFAQAVSLLRERSLCAYYDTVVIEGLRYARNDLLRGRITADQLRHIKKAALDLIERLEPGGDLKSLASRRAQLAGQTDEGVRVLPQPVDRDRADAAEARSVMCVGGRGKLDSLAVAVTTQVLTKFGFAVGHSSYERFTRHDPVDFAGAAIFCVVSFDAIENPPYLRSLLRRLHQSSATAHLIVGLAARESELGGEFQEREASVVATLDALVDACRHAVCGTSGDCLPSRHATDARGWSWSDPEEAQQARRSAAEADEREAERQNQKKPG